MAEETISSMRTVRSFANERSEAESYHSKLLLVFQLNKKEALAYACYMWSSYVSAGRYRNTPLLSCAFPLPLQQSCCVYSRSLNSVWRSLSSTMAAILLSPIR